MRNSFLAALAVTAILSSCTKEERIDGIVPESQKAKLSINVGNPTSRAVGAAGAVPADAISNYVAFIFDVAGNLEIAPVVSESSASSDNINVTTSATDVYVVANIPSAQITGITTKAGLEAYIADLPTTGLQSTARWISGKNTSPISFTQSVNSFTANVTVNLTFVSARIKVTIEDGMGGSYSSAATDGSLVLTSVAVLNAGGATKLFSTPLIPTSFPAKQFYSGIDKQPAFTYWPLATDYAVETPLLIDAVAADDFTSSYYYYVFENNATAVSQFPTIVTLIGTYDGQAIYFPVHLAPYEQWAAGSGTVPSIQRGKSYNINIKLSGDPHNTTDGDFPGNTGGTNDPTEPIVTATVNVTVTLTDWEGIDLNKEYQ